MSEKENNKKAIFFCGIIVIAMIAGIFYLTFQSPQQTTKLSETVRIWLKDRGWEMTPKQIRSNVHIPMYFLLGLVIFFFGRTMRWKWFFSLFNAMAIALLDEGIKVILPTREFDCRDLMKDFLGISGSWLLMGVFMLIKKVYLKRKKNT